jgi:hypothetical protein
MPAPVQREQIGGLLEVGRMVEIWGAGPVGAGTTSAPLQQERRA